MRVSLWSRLSRIPLGYRLVLLVSAILVVPLVFQFLYVGPFLRDREIQKELDAQEALGALLSERIDNTISKYLSWLENIAHHESVKQLDPEGIEVDLAMRLDALEWMHALAVLDKNSTVIYERTEDGFDEVLAGYVHEAGTSPLGARSGSVKMHEETGKLLFPLYLSVPAIGASESNGLLLGVFDLDEMKQRLIVDLKTSESRAFLVDRHGRLLADCCVGGVEPLSDCSSYLAVQHILENPTTAEQHPTLEDTGLLTTYAALDQVPWDIVVEAPMQGILVRSSLLSRRILTVNSSVLGIMLVLAWVLAVWIARQRERYERGLYDTARRDALTGLRNRFALEERIQQEQARSERYGHPVGILMIDVNRFKEVNDRFGHQMGDEVLQGVADALRESVRETDTAFRYGGDEFLVLLPETVGEMETVRQRIQEAVTRRNELDPLLDFPVTLAIGVAEWEPQMTVSLEQVIGHADSRMYGAKRQRETA